MVVVNYTQANTQLLIINLLFFFFAHLKHLKSKDKIFREWNVKILFVQLFFS